MTKESGYEHVVIGGGFAGLYSAYKLAQAGFNVAVIERREQLMSEASHNNFARIHHGWHYPGSLQTALECIPAALEFLQDFSDTLIGGSQSIPHTGWCAISRNSFTDIKEWLENAAKMQSEYEARMKIFRINFDPSESFFKIVDCDKWRGYIDPSLIDVVISTIEAFVDLGALKEKMIRQIDSHPRISVLLNHSVSGVRRVWCANGDDIFDLDIHSAAGNKTIRAERVINATWVYRTKLDAMLGSRMSDVAYRLKTFLQLKLPKRLEALPSLLVVHGPFMTFTNCGNGIGFVDYAPVSNHDISSGSVPQSWTRMLRGDFEDEERERIGTLTLRGADLFVPGIKDSKIIEMRAGVLSHEGNADIYDPNAAVHHRLGTGLKVIEPNWISLDTGKLSWVPRYANEVVSYCEGSSPVARRTWPRSDRATGARCIGVGEHGFGAVT